MTEPVQEIVVRSDVAPDGSYVVAMEFGPDESFILDRQGARDWATSVIAAAAAADYDAAVLRQLSAIEGMEREHTAQIISDLRAERPATRTGPLELVPGVSNRDGRGFLTIHLHGKVQGQWELDDALSHALAVVEVEAIVDLDATYRKVLVGLVGLDDLRARNVVAQLEEHRRPMT